MPHGDHRAIQNPHGQVDGANDMTFKYRSPETNFNDTQSYTRTEYGAAECENYPDEFQLQLWVYETSGAKLTVAEILEKAKWETERLERL